MSPRSWSFRVDDIVKAIEAIQSYTAGMQFGDFVRDRRTVDAVVRNLIVIGEAASRIPADVVRLHPEVPWAEMSAMRNVVIHEYFGVSDRIVWDTVQRDLPPVVQPLRNVLAES